MSTLYDVPIRCTVRYIVSFTANFAITKPDKPIRFAVPATEASLKLPPSSVTLFFLKVK